mgnify:CR=1 FL=1
MTGQGPTTLLRTGQRVVQHRTGAVWFVTNVTSRPETRSIFHVSGQADFLIHIAVADSTHLQAFLMDKIASRAEVRNLTSSVVLERVETRALTPPDDQRPTHRRRRV